MHTPPPPIFCVVWVIMSPTQRFLDKFVWCPLPHLVVANNIPTYVSSMYLEALIKYCPLMSAEVRWSALKSFLISIIFSHIKISLYGYREFQVRGHKVAVKFQHAPTFGEFKFSCVHVWIVLVHVWIVLVHVWIVLVFLCQRT